MMVLGWSVSMTEVRPREMRVAISARAEGEVILVVGLP